MLNLLEAESTAVIYYSTQQKSLATARVTDAVPEATARPANAAATMSAAHAALASNVCHNWTVVYRPERSAPLTAAGLLPTRARTLRVGSAAQAALQECADFECLCAVLGYRRECRQTSTDSGVETT